MSDLRAVKILKKVPVKDAPGLHGKDIGTIYGNYQPFYCTVDYAQEDDAFVPMIDPPAWKDTGKVGWLKKSWCIEEVAGEHSAVITFYDDGRPPSIKEI